MLLLTVFVDLIVAVAVGCAVMSVLYVKDTAAVQLSHCSLLNSASDTATAPAGLKELTSEEARLLSLSGGHVGFFMLEVRLLLINGIDCVVFCEVTHASRTAGPQLRQVHVPMATIFGASITELVCICRRQWPAA